MYMFREYRVNVAVNILKKKLSFFNVRALNARSNELLGVRCSHFFRLYRTLFSLPSFTLFERSFIRLETKWLDFFLLFSSSATKLSFYRYKWFFIVSICVLWTTKCQLILVASSVISNLLWYQKRNKTKIRFKQSNIYFSPPMTIIVTNI